MPSSRSLAGAAVSVDHGKGIPAVDALGIELILGDAAQSCKVAIRHGLALGLAAHAVVVVVEVVDDGKSALVAVLPELVELIHSGEVHRLVNRAAGRGAVTGVGNNNTRLLIALFVKGNTGSDRTGAADDGVVGVNAEGEEEGVHRAAEASGEAHVLGKQLAGYTDT